MKELFSFKRVTSLVALMLAVVMLFSGCGSKNTASNSSDLNSEGDQAQITASEDGQEGVEGGDNTEGGSDKTTGNNSKTNKNNSKTTGNNSKTTGANKTGKTTFASDPYSEITSDVKAKGIHILMWRDYTDYEKELISGFEKKTGMKVRTTVTTEAEYSTKLISLIAGKDSPDVACLASNTFPGVALKSLQPLDKETFRLDDDFWYKDYMDPLSANGNYYSVAGQGTWNSEDVGYCTYYNVKLLKQCGINEDPWELYKKGQWNWDKQTEMAKKVKAKSSNYIGLSQQDSSLFMYSAGQDFVTYDGKQYKSTLDSLSSSSMLVKAWQQQASLYKDGICVGWDLNNVQQGKVGFFTAILYGMQKYAGFFASIAHTEADIKAVPVASPKGSANYMPLCPKTWGVAKKAANPEGAAFFCRYWLDSKNGNIDATFCNNQMKEVFKTITARNFKKKVMMARGIVDYVSTGKYDGLESKLTNSTPEQIVTALNSQKSTINTGMNRANKDLAKVKKAD